MIRFEPATIPATTWAERIRTAWQSTTFGIIETGRLIIDAKEALQHGEFIAMVESDLPFGRRTAHRLMAISGDPRITNGTHVSLLPPAWGTLYELTKLDDNTFGDAIERGIIRPDMQRKDVPRPPRAGPKPIPPAPATRGKDVIRARVREAIIALTGLPPAHEVVKFFEGTDDAILVSEKLQTAAAWLATFANNWPQEDVHVEAAE